MGSLSAGNASASAAQSAGVVVPVKAFSKAKQRLAPQLSPSERADLARAMAAHVVSAAAPLEVFVVCDDAEVANWAKSLSVEPVMCPGAGLNPAVTQGVEHLRRQGFRRAIIAHGDLPFATGFAQFADGQVADEQIADGGAEASVGIAPDRWGKGTNVLSVPADCGFGFSYGPGSFHRHAREAERLGLTVKIHRDASLAWDIDLPCDLSPEVMLLLSPASGLRASSAISKNA